MERPLSALRGAGWKVAQHVEKSDGRVQWTMTHPERDPLTIEADSDAVALSHLLKRAGMAPERNEMHDNGPWTVGVEKDRTHRVFIQSEDMTHDVRLYLDGDFRDIDDCRTYADNLAIELNALPKTPPARVRTPLKTRATEAWTRISASRAARGFALGVILAIAGILGFISSPRRPDPMAIEARADAYRDARTALRTCPAAGPAIRQALADGRITVGEAQRLHEIVQGAAGDYRSSVDLDQARTAIGLPVYALPPRCADARPRKDDDAGPGSDLFEEYRVDETE